MLGRSRSVEASNSNLARKFREIYSSEWNHPCRSEAERHLLDLLRCRLWNRNPRDGPISRLRTLLSRRSGFGRTENSRRLFGPRYSQISRRESCGEVDFTAVTAWFNGL